MTPSQKAAFITSVLLVLDTGLSLAAPSSQEIKQKFQPIIRVIQDIAEPISYGMMMYGFIKMAMGGVGEGKKMIGNAVKGYVGVQMVPWVFDIIRDIFR